MTMNRDEYLRAHAERRAAILAHFRQSGNLSETGRAFGISRQRVQQIVNMMEAKDGPLCSDREVLGGNGLHGQGDPPQD
jgi:molybdenum-dependent DNA-binding transcriptional regulator ModE